MIYKLKIWLEGDESIIDSSEFRDFYFNVSRITGWYIPDEKEEIPEGAINMLFDGDMVSIKQEPHILEYLKKEFGDRAITTKNFKHGLQK